METKGYDKEIIEKIKQEYSADDKPKIAHSTKSNRFTNEYGTSRTKCAYSTCNNVIASTGDTNCCIIHSNHCLSCGKYIDGDATWCMTCLSDALSWPYNFGNIFNPHGAICADFFCLKFDPLQKMKSSQNRFIIIIESKKWSLRQALYSRFRFSAELYYSAAGVKK